LRGGGVAFGPHPRSYEQRIPKKMRRLALRCTLSSKIAEGELIIVDHLQLKEPRTKEMMHILEALKVSYPSVVVTGNFDANVIRSARNLPGVKTLSADGLNVVDVLSCKSLLMTVAAVRRAEQLWSLGQHTTQGDVKWKKAA
jgi:large subunit ribosomal protein L4